MDDNKKFFVALGLTLKPQHIRGTDSESTLKQTDNRNDRSSQAQYQ